MISIWLWMACTGPKEETICVNEDCDGDVLDTGNIPDDTDSEDTGFTDTEDTQDTGSTETDDTQDTDDTDDTQDTQDTEDTHDTNEETDVDPLDADDDGDGLTENEGDCDDGDPNIPGDEYCDGIDNDCDGTVDGPTSLDALTWYVDNDGDGFGVDTGMVNACSQPSGYADTDTDCNDADASINPNATEIWYDGIDQNCDAANDYDGNFDGIDDRRVDLSNIPQFVMELHPIGNNYGNALQGLAIDVERDEIWMSVDTSSFYENVLINKLSLQSGNSLYCEEYTESAGIPLGHGQDLSIEYTASGERKLWIGSESDRGVTRINPENMTIETLNNLLPSGWSHSTPTIGLQNQWIAVRGSEDGNSSNNDWIRIYDKSAIESGFVTGIAPSPLYEFNIASAQRVSDMWFQGIALDEEVGVVYALTGDNTLSQSNKLLYVYDLNGVVLEQTTINMDWSTANAFGSKYEPEGLSLVQNPSNHERYLYFTMMFGSSGNNIKRLYGIAPNHISLGGTYSNNDIDWLLRYNTYTGEVSISTATLDGTVGCETKRTTWSNGWTSFEGYRVNGEPHLLLQKEIGGTTKIHPLDWDAELNSATKNSTWSNGWSQFHTWEHAGDTHLFHYKSGSSTTGLMRVSELTSSGDTDCCTEDEYWSTGWLTHRYTLPNGDDYLLRFNSSTNAVRIAPLGTGTIGTEIFNSTWTTDYGHFDSLQIGSKTYLVALDDSGTLTSFEAGSTGLLQSVDTYTTVLTNWSNLQAYNLEGTPVVHLYRPSDGFFTLIQLDGNGMIDAVIDSGFEDAGWTGWTHFTTSTQ